MTLVHIGVYANLLALAGQHMLIASSNVISVAPPRLEADTPSLLVAPRVPSAVTVIQFVECFHVGLRVERSCCNTVSLLGRTSARGESVRCCLDSQ
jgi:hypothetical protein